MNKVDFPFWDDEGKKAITEIYRVKNQMQNVGVRLKTNDISNEDFSVFLDNVYETLKYWTGHTYIVQKKDKAFQKAYQTFLKDCTSSFLFEGNLVILCLSLFRTKFGIVVRYIDI